MSKFDVLQDRALELAGHIGDGIRHTIPEQAGKWLQTGAAIGAARVAAQTAGRSVRRHPGISGSVVVAVLAGAGLLLWANKRRKERQLANGGETIEGQARRVEARRAPRKTARRTTSRAGTRRSGASTPSSSED
ncbi:hypothetical protein [Luteimonas abyssi]|uniref:hypothetical protein n=1 Tax=Luteimonas abyssi TaxID=1247514 RepID=UPI000737CF5E|nr:hypothetical protein [Luteimonas abyssi]